MKKLHTYTRILLSLLLMLITNVVMGQGLPKIPITGITGYPNPADDDHKFTYLYDGLENTSLKQWRNDDIHILEYMQIKNPDNSNDGKRSWVEIPYVPNQNTEIEVVIQPKNANVADWKTEYVFGSGDLNGPGMSFGLAHTGARTQNSEFKNMYLYGVSSQRFEKVSDTFNTENKQTILCTSNSISIDGVEAIQYNSATYNVGNKKLCLFCNPYAGWDGARCFEGRIYSVKIRENGKMIYDLLPCNAWGRSGFYDRITGNPFFFFDMVDYIENTASTTADNAQNHIFIKVPYGLTMGDGYNKNEVTWTGNLVTNGDFANNTITSFGFRNNAWQPRIVTKNGKKALRIVNNGQRGTNPWSCQLNILLNEGVEMVKNSDNYTISFDYMAERPAVIEVQQQSNRTGGYYRGLNNTEACSSTEWKHYESSGTVQEPWDPAENDTRTVQAFGLNLNKAVNTDDFANIYYISNIVIKKGSDVVVTNGNLDSNDEGAFKVTDDWTDQILTIDGKKCIQVVNDGSHGSGYPWDVQFRMKLSESMNEGDKYYISFNIKAKEEADIDVQLQQANEGYYGNTPQIHATTSWQKIVQSETIGAHDGSVAAIALMLNTSKTANTYYITDIVIKKGTENQQPLPSAEVEVQYQSTNPNENQQLRRHIFTYGTFEEGVMGLSTHNYNRYIYRSGQKDEQTSTPVGENRNTVIGALQEWDWNDEHNVVSGAPTWSQGSAFYFMGTETTDNADNAASFWGRMYGAKVTEGGEVKLNLVPARNGNEEYGLYDKVNRVFYPKDSGSSKNAKFTGASVTQHGGEITEVESVKPFILTINTNEQIARNFVITTTDDSDLNTNPKRWILYGTKSDVGDNTQWTPIEVHLAPRFSPMATDGETIQYLYNVETGQFLTSAGKWGTGASLETGNVRKFIVEIDGKTYKLKNSVIAEDITANGKYLFSDGNNEIYTDYNNFGKFQWNVSSLGGNIYELSIPDIGKMGIGDEYETSNQHTLVVSSSTSNTTWAFVNQADYDTYIEALNAGTTDQSKPLDKDGFEYIFRLNTTEAYKHYRFVVENVTGTTNDTDNTLDLQELSFTTDYDFEHYQGRVYDNMGTPPANLAVGGSSGYTDMWKTSTDDPRLGDNKIQRTHEYEHEIYVMPGQTVELTPFADFSSTNTGYNYQEHYIRWYDYQSDRYTSRLSFDDFEGRNVVDIDEGFFAWNRTERNNNPRRTREGGTAKYTASANPVADANGVIDVIAIEAGNTYDGYGTMVGDEECYTIKEPTLLWRHTFVIKDAKQRSDEMFASKKANDDYIDAHKIKLMCPANVPFQYPLPCQEYVGTGAERPTNYYYIDNTTGNYTPIYHYTIDTYKLNADGTTYTRLGSRNHSYAGGSYSDEVMAQLAYPYKELDGYNRVFYIKNPQVGKYKIIINALGAAYAGGLRDQRIGSVDAVQIMMYELEVLPPADGVMITEDELKTNSDYAHQRPANMNSAFGKPTTEVNFDDVEDLTSYSNDGVSGGYLKWPWQWEYSSYGFGYENRGDYNMYMITDIGGLTPFHGEGDRFRYIYDRKYYDNGNDVNKRGYFFYANAASDPSRMSVLNIGKNFCPNTKVFVSAWINEMQGPHQQIDWGNGGVGKVDSDGNPVMEDPYAETANVIFSFRGVKADGTETVLNSFVSGYVPGGWNTPYGLDKDGFIAAHTTDSDGDGKVDNPDNRGKWMHVYYTFKTGPEAEGFDHYIITLENNCTSSVGADYAIDDIRCYVRKPQVEASQFKPVCNGDAATDLKIYADFDQLKDVFAFDEVNSTMNLYYCFLDREKYESELKKAYDEGVADGKINSTTYPTLADWREKVDKSNASDPFRTAYDNAFNAALVKNTYGTGHENYGVLTFNKQYDQNPEFVQVEGWTNPATLYQAQRQDLGTTRNLVFPCTATDAQMYVDKKYVIALIKEYDDSKSVGVNFRLEDQCQASSDFEVIFSGEVKIDGKLMSSEDGLDFCSNQRPVVTINLNGIGEGGLPIKTELAYFDWYYGPYLLNQEEKDQGWSTSFGSEAKGTLSLHDALAYFREKNPSATQDDVVNNTNLTVDGTVFTQEMLTYIQEMVAAKKLVLYKKTEAMSTTDLFSTTELQEPTIRKKFYVTAVPINPTPLEPNVKYCLQPIKVTINLSDRTPKMKDGDDQGLIPYPTTMRDVPLRIGLKQLKRAVLNETAEKPGLNATTATNKLLIPLREVTPSTSGVQVLIQKQEDDLVYLAASNDPNILAGTSGAVDITESSPYGPVISDLKVVGKVITITADKNKHGTPFDPANESTNPGNICHLAFLQNFKFREGYWYTLKFHFEENYNVANPGDHSEVCPGDVIFTVKVVPEYQMWTGEYSRNWNDDRNWKRVSKADLLWDQGRKDDAFLAANADYVTDGGTNDTEFCYAPADFTKVIIPAGTKFTPYMYEMRDNPNLLEVNITGAPSKTNYLKRTAADRTEFMGAKNKEIGLTTNLVKFDMASVEKRATRDGDIACRTWYDHTCDQIHFNAGAEIMDQRYLHYNKAWCDIDVAPGTWQTVSSPLMNIVAGDLYLPTATARQETPLFEDITYQTSLNDRFKPAVYQRSWNKGAKATVYKLDQSSTNVGVNLDWSHVYNDVNVEYGAGQGFSIKVDVSAMPEANQPGKNGNPEMARFRFPKADKSYTYYSPENTNGDKRTEDVNSTDIVTDPITGEKVRPGKLSDLTSAFEQKVGGDTQVGTQYFLVGNPLMCYLDMNEFFRENSSLYEPKYWVVTPEGQRGAVQQAGATSFTGTDPYQGILPPGVSFFVQLKQDPTTPGTDVNTTPKFTADMMIYELGEKKSENDEPVIDEGATEENNDPLYGQNGNVENPSNPRNAPRRQTRAAAAEAPALPKLRLTAESLNGRKSLALLTDGTMAQHTMLETLFDSNLKDDALLYTTKDGMAKTIASIAPGDTLPLAVSGARDEVQLSIEGVKDFDFDLFLIDSEEGTVEPLEGDVVLKQDASGVRYYIATRSANDTEVEGDVNVPRVTAKDGYITVYAPAACEIETSAIYNTGGIRMDFAEHIAESHSVKLLPGIYIVHLLCDGKTYTYKLMLR